MRFPLKFRRGGRKIGVLVAEQLVGNFARQKHAHIARFMNGAAQKIHAHRCEDGADVVSGERRDYLLERGKHLLARHVNFVVFGADVVRHLAGVL